MNKNKFADPVFPVYIMIGLRILVFILGVFFDISPTLVGGMWVLVFVFFFMLGFLLYEKET